MLISFMAIELVSVSPSCDIVTNGNRVNARLLVGIFVKLCIKFTFKLAGLEDRIPVGTPSVSTIVLIMIINSGEW